MAKATTAWKNLGRNRFASRLSENIKKHSRLLLYPGGNVTMVKVNRDFAYELVEIFNETIIDLLLEGEAVNFDQFGKYEIKVQSSKRVKSPFVGNQEIFLPELKMIRFYPAKRLKERIRGNAFGRARRNFGFSSDSVEKGGQKVIEGEKTDDGD